MCVDTLGMSDRIIIEWRRNLLIIKLNKRWLVEVIVCKLIGNNKRVKGVPHLIFLGCSSRNKYLDSIY